MTWRYLQALFCLIGFLLFWALDKHANVAVEQWAHTLLLTTIVTTGFAATIALAVRIVRKISKPLMSVVGLHGIVLITGCVGNLVAIGTHLQLKLTAYIVIVLHGLVLCQTAWRKLRSEEKEEISVLIPYWIQNRTISVYLQRRSDHDERLPGYFAFFGGHAEEGEFPEDTLRRAIQEDLGISLSGFELFERFVCGNAFMQTYVLRAQPDFEKSVCVQEGEYGKFFTEPELSGLLVSAEDREVLRELFAHLQTLHASELKIQHEPNFKPA